MVKKRISSFTVIRQFNFSHILSLCFIESVATVVNLCWFEISVHSKEKN
jgi:hypothetical protein